MAQGEAGTGNVVEAVRHARAVQGAIRQLQTMDDDELYVYAKVGAVIYVLWQPCCGCKQLLSVWPSACPAYHAIDAAPRAPATCLPCSPACAATARTNTCHPCPPHLSPPQELRAPVELVRQTKALGRLPVVNFAAGGVATPADAALMMQVGAAEGWGWAQVEERRCPRGSAVAARNHCDGQHVGGPAGANSPQQAVRLRALLASGSCPSPPAALTTPSPTLSTLPQLGMDGVFVGSGIFKSGDPAKRARAIVQVRGSQAKQAVDRLGCPLACTAAVELATSAVELRAWM